MMDENKPVRALVLAGGGAKGSYQVGVWRALTELGWRPDIITGTSVGSLNGALFVMDQYETARDMWLTIRSKDVMTLPESTSVSKLRPFLKDAVSAGGLDVSPLESIVDLMLDGDAMRASSIAFGLVTVELDGGLHARELTLDEIPQGKVKDYLLASAACFPAMRPRVIDGKTYLDGGYSDNMPQGLAKRMGATELLCVDLEGVGITRPNFTALPTTVIRSYWNLGDILRFSPETSRRNIELGYYDTLRTFGRVRGCAYAVEINHPERAVRQRVEFDLHLAQLRASWSAVAIAVELALAAGKWQDETLAPLEAAAEAVGVEPTQLFTADTLGQAFLNARDPEKGKEFLPLLCGEGNAALAAKAAVLPLVMIQILEYQALTNPIRLEVTIE
jgi:NTE family protein